jgi:hypothetical protein
LQRGLPKGAGCSLSGSQPRRAEWRGHGPHLGRQAGQQAVAVEQHGRFLDRLHILLLRDPGEGPRGVRWRVCAASAWRWGRAGGSARIDVAASAPLVLLEHRGRRTERAPEPRSAPRPISALLRRLEARVEMLCSRQPGACLLTLSLGPRCLRSFEPQASQRVGSAPQTIHQSPPRACPRQPASRRGQGLACLPMWPPEPPRVHSRDRESLAAI